MKIALLTLPFVNNYGGILQAYALKGGLNGIMVGGYLTTGGRSPQDDLQMIQDLELSRNSAQV